MKPSKLTVYELFEKERRYVLPVFQRPYVWKEEEQWEPLWEDVQDMTDRVLARDNRSQVDVPVHFLGAVVLAQIPTFGRQVNASDVVDGQQRLTTLQILLAALRDASHSTGDEELEKVFRRLILNTCRMESEYEQYKVWPTTTDRSAFEQVVTAGSADAVQRRFPLIRRKYQRQPDPRHQIAEAYLYFFSRIESYLRESDNNDEQVLPESGLSAKLDALLDAITKYMEIVVIELEEDDDPQVIFESLNGRGAPLLPSDLVRNFVFLEATRRTEAVIEDLYEAYWSRFDVGEEGTFWKEEVKQGRIKRPRIDLFLFHYVTARTGRDTRITHLYQEFRRWWGADRNVATELARLGEYADVFAWIVDPPDESQSRVDLFARRLSALDISTVYPVLLHLFVEESFSEDDLDLTAETIESFLVRRLVCELTPKNYNRLFLGLLKHLREAVKPSPQTIEEYLLRGEGDSVRWPEDEEFSNAWRSLPAYKRLRRSQTGMILRALDRRLVTERQEGLNLPRSLSIEHILPVGATEGNWPYIDTDEFHFDAESDTTPAEVRSRFLHRFGNLTLLTQELNSSVSNGPFSTKRPKITAQSELRLNSYFQRFSDVDRWAEPEIDKRTLELGEIALNIWPRPE